MTDTTASDRAPDGAHDRSRAGADRRHRPTPRLSRRSFLGGRRRRARREGEGEHAFVDLYSVKLLLILLWIALMNVADSFFTLVHLQHGGTEVNPVAGMMLQTGLTSFVVLKSALIGLALLVLCVHKNFHLARLGLWVAAIAYTLLFAYHLSLFGV
ncbi:MAG: hypothetical protein HZA53_07035 [Planctomycetes bacterium]|nr:hypothetical protein [Planctomycetota bacterium]